MRAAALTGLLLVGCTDAGLYRPDADANRANRLTISGSICTEDPAQQAFPVRLVFLVDSSAEAAAADPAALRVDAVEQVFGRLAATANYQFSVIGYSDGVRDLTGGFTRDATALTEAAEGLRAATPGNSRDLATGLLAVENTVVDALLSVSPGEASRTTFVVVVFSAGMSRPAADDEAGERAEQVRQLRAQVERLGGAGLRLHTALLKPSDERQARQASSLMEDMALAGRGASSAFDLAQQITYLGFDLAAGATDFVRKQLLVVNVNARSTPDGAVPDSDADGLSDAEERAFGTDPLLADTDGDALGDRVELIGGSGGQDPLVADAPAACASLERPDGDSDADGLTDCEERTLGTDPTLFDSDAQPDGVPDRVEVLCDTNPLHDDTFGDYDFDGENNGEECRAHTDARGDDGDARWELAYRYREFEQGVRRVPFSSQPVSITGVAILGVSPASTPGVGTLRWVPSDSGGGSLTWGDAADAGGEPVAVGPDGAQELDLPSLSAGRSLRVRIEPRLLPVVEASDPIVIGASDRRCYDFRVTNVTLVETADTGRGRGANDIFVYFGQAPEGRPESPGLFRVALVRARYLAPDYREPASPEVVLDDSDFVLFGD